MAIPRPKILSVVTVPTGGWTLKIYASDSTQYDTAITCTMDAGDYFVAFDNQDDDFLYELSTKLRDAIKTALSSASNEQVAMWIDSSHKVHIAFVGSDFTGATGQDVKIAWTENDGDEIGKVLGFDVSADDTATGSDNPTLTADRHHAYGWYADEDGLLEELLDEDVNETDTVFARAISGRTSAVTFGQRFTNSLSLQFLSSAKTFSRDVGYTESPVYPYAYNEPLECFWEQARKGKRFRVYRNGYVDTARAIETGESSSATGSSMTDTGKSWSEDPDQFAGAILYSADFSTMSYDVPAAWYIASNDSDTVTMSNSHPTAKTFGLTIDTTYYIFDHTYQTYVIDLSQMRTFQPGETVSGVERYSVTFPLLRYVS